ncbi:hypothetical protein ACP70R_006175 [Stipagrostis hirtigluma subsp. patula]
MWSTKFSENPLVWVEILRGGLKLSDAGALRRPMPAGERRQREGHAAFPAVRSTDPRDGLLWREWRHDGTGGRRRREETRWRLKGMRSELVRRWRLQRRGREVRRR